MTITIKPTWGFGGVTLDIVGVCGNTMPRRKDTCNDLRDGNVALTYSGMGFDSISKQFEDYRSTVRKIIHKWKTLEPIILRMDVLACSLQVKKVQCSGELQETKESHLRLYRFQLA
ncbi:hypothetical protein GOODEAATRI_006443 [Goodea atripinnis]|uniref:Uncharacterized protein n=1 Tax=Goodea atripinnis TaxID=208336 RepID=A0ABV0P249_9TELE